MTKTIFGYILNKVAYKENDLIVTILTRDGLDSFKVRGGLKVPNKYSFLIEDYNYGEFMVYSKTTNSTYNLKEGRVLKNVPKLFEDFKLNTLLSFTAEAIIKSDYLKDKFEIFDGVVNLIQQDYYAENIVLIVLKYVLAANGSFLDADGCIKCGSKNNLISISYSDGGFICNECNKNYNYKTESTAYLKAFRFIVKANILDANKYKIEKEIYSKLLKEFFDLCEENIGFVFKTKQMIKQIL